MDKAKKKIDRIVIPCTVDFKKTYKKIVAKAEDDQAGFGMGAIMEKIKRDNLGEDL